MSSRGVRLLGLGLAVGLACACAPAGDGADCQPLRRGGGEPAASLVIAVGDTVRRDAIGAHGGAATPVFDAFAQEHLLFSRASSQAPRTKPSVATLFTGLLPSRHGVLEDPRLPLRRAGAQGREADALPAALETLAEVLRRDGFRTAAFVSNPWMGSAFGYAQGFEVYDDSFARFDAPGEQVTRGGLEWLATIPEGQPYFLYLHYIDAHPPYGALTPEEVYVARPRLEADTRPVTPFAREALADLRTPEDLRLLLVTGAPPRIALLELAYERGVRDFDRVLGELLAGVRARTDWARTAMIVTADHGEAFFERGYGNHARALFENELAIPLAVRLPGALPERGASGCEVGLVDLLPTLCDALELACPAGDGQSLFRADDARALLAEGVPGQPTHRAARSGRFKLIYEPEGPLGPDLTRDAEKGRAHPYALYDLDADPDERRDLLAEPEPPAEALRAFESLRAALEARASAGAAPVERAPLDAESERRLEALGYLDGTR